MSASSGRAAPPLSPKRVPDPSAAPLVVIVGPPGRASPRLAWDWPGNWAEKSSYVIPRRFIADFDIGTSKPSESEQKSVRASSD